MAMHIGSSDQESDGLLSTINTTPLVDVMLVLLIIFLITIPAVTASINVQLPRESQRPHEIKAESLVLTVDVQGVIYIDKRQISSTELSQKMKLLAMDQPQLEVQIIGDAGTAFQWIGRVLSIVKQAGLNKVNFLTEPEGATLR